MIGRPTFLKLLTFLLVFAAAVTFSIVSAAANFPLRDLSDTILFIPLLWAFMAFSPAWMVVSGTALAVCQFVVEIIRAWQPELHWNTILFRASAEAIWPAGLCLALGLVLFSYRRRQRLLVSQLVEAGTQAARHQLANTLTHDFNNVLTVMIGTSELMLRDATLAPEHRNDIEAILKAGREGSSLMDQLRGASRVGPTSFAVRLDFADLIETQLDLVQKLLPSNIHVLRHSGPPLPVRADKGQILRVLMNLCLNARDAMPGGGVLTVQTAKKTVDGSDWAVLTVGDTGPGVNPGDMERIFEPFYTTKAQSGGVGLGLSIVHSVATSHNGTVQVRNVPGAGASFSFMIPMDGASVDATPPTTRAGDAPTA